MESSKLDNDSCSTEFLAGLKLENDSCSTEFLASIEDLLDFSDSEIANPVFGDVCKSEFPAGAQVKAELPEFISGDVCKSEFPAGVQVKTEPPEFISAGSGVHDSGELFVPSDDLEDMDWLSCLLEDPIPTIPAGIPPKHPKSDSSTPAFIVKPPKQTTSEEFRTTSPTSVLETTFPLQVPKSEIAFPSPETTFPLQVPKSEIASPRPETAFPSPETTFPLQVPKSETAFPRPETAFPRPVTTIPARRRTKRPRPTFTKICWFLPRIISRETSPENNSDDFSSGYGPHMIQKKNKKRKSPHEKENTYEINRRCMHCSIQKTPQWRTGPMGPKTLCNACGVRYKSGRLLPEYRPAASPTFTPLKHSNSHRKVMEMRIKKWNKEKHECLEERFLLDPILHD